MKKLLSILVIVAVLFLTTLLPVYANNDEINVYLNGSKIEFDAPTQIINGRTMVPMRTIFEALGAIVEWDNETKTASARKMGITVKITINDNVMLKNFCEISLDTPAQIVNGRTLALYVPFPKVLQSMSPGIVTQTQLLLPIKIFCNQLKLVINYFSKEK